MDTNQIIRDLDELAQDSVKIYPNMRGLENINHILMVRTVRPLFFWPIIEKIKNIYTNMRISIIGDESDIEWIKKNGFEEKSLFIHHGSMCREVFEIHYNQLKDVDAVCYVGPSVYRQSYLNVLDACSYYANKLRISLFACIRSEESIYKIIDSDKLIMALRITGTMIEYTNQLLKRS